MSGCLYLVCFPTLYYARKKQKMLVRKEVGYNTSTLQEEGWQIYQEVDVLQAGPCVCGRVASWLERGTRCDGGLAGHSQQTPCNR